MMLRALTADLLKARRKGIWFLVFLGPLGLVAMQGLNFGLRYDYLIPRYKGRLWEGLMDNIAIFVPLALVLGATMVASMLANVEHSSNSWKQLLALPISKFSVYMAKLMLAIGMLCVSCLLLTVGTWALGMMLGFGGEPAPVGELLRLGFWPLGGTLPMLVLLLWLTVTFHNQALPVTLGITLGIGSLFASQLSEWFPLAWPQFAWVAPQAWMFASVGCGTGMLLSLLTAAHFSRKDVA
ncbi:ABC transporter permease [Paenibacillus polymyxa]|uniref:ABC transporter permease n=1 Tax=Paenibacillus polymyxa TaxID=1406 RepID=UPI002AB5763D|nr:ABC transporter permease [Paenibacillus polymyxa]MDY8025014.1 ABC transporter permease [Paenibacillus polymyxa]